MIVKLLTEHHLGCLSLKGGCKGSSESPLVKMSNCWKSHAAAQLFLFRGYDDKLELTRRFKQIQLCFSSFLKVLVSKRV